MSYTVGLELEWADIDRHATIESNLGTWNTKDYSIVNSDGHANCPAGLTWRWGGEINTCWTHTSQVQSGIVDVLAKQLNPTINYKCNLHVHVRPDVDLIHDLSLLKRVAIYLKLSERFVYSTIEPIAKPTKEEFATEEEFKGAKKRYQRRRVSHQYSLPFARWDEMMSATTPEKFLEAHAPPKWDGGRAWHIAPRPGMNMRSLWKHGTIEYRHFPGTADPVEIESAAEWCLRFTRAAVEGGPSPEEIYAQREWKFPQFKPYDHKLQLGYEATRHRS